MLVVVSLALACLPQAGISSAISRRAEHYAGLVALIWQKIALLRTALE